MSALEIGSPRVGWCWSAELPEMYPAMVHDTGSAIEVVVTYEHGHPLERQIAGRGVKWGDDPEYAKYSYALPEPLWFVDARGYLCLIGPQGRSWKISNLCEGRMRFRYALETGDQGIDYRKVNAVRSRIEGLEQWMPISSVGHERLHDDDGIATDRITLLRQKEVRFSRRLNGALRPEYRFAVSDEPGRSLIEDSVSVQTMVKVPVALYEHLDVHRSISELLTVAGWRKCGIWGLEVQRADDPVRALARNVLGPRWAPVATHEIESPSGGQAANRFLFEFDDLGGRGLGRWATLRSRFRRGIAGMISSVIRPGASLDTVFSDAGSAMESIGFGIALERGESAGQRIRTHLRRITSEVNVVVGFDTEDWVLRFADQYRAVKHPDRPDPDTLELLNSLRKARLLFRAWVATRLGMEPDRLERKLRVIPMSRPYELM